ncbi:hypothetical protein Hanom_Chr04g00331241 [Helianthus anomalus]
MEALDVVTYLLHSTEFNSALGEVYTKSLNYGKHLGLVAGFKLHESGQALEQSHLFLPESSDIFKESIHQMERLTYPYVCAEVLNSLSKKHSRSSDSEETFSEDADVSNEASLEGSAVAGDGGPEAKKAKKAKKGKSDGSRDSKPSVGV